MGLYGDVELIKEVMARYPKLDKVLNSYFEREPNEFNFYLRYKLRELEQRRRSADVEY